ncbi:hypothetical protein A9Q99_24670 [Gammaproteobacteria bacterium 45_16_T64]|nr:hypothetical protein A9Q99_24670 [Gammaproteobacteria bacterium 45_16_T64]
MLNIAVRFIGVAPYLCRLLLLSLLWITHSSYAHVPADFSIGAPDPFQQWKVLETENFRINYQSEHQAYAQKMAAIAENVHTKTTKLMNWVPENKTEIIINDSIDMSNGGASTLPYNRFFILMNTPTEGQLQDNGGWLELVFTHEYIHILHLDQASKFPALARNIVGRLFFTFPQIFNPKWITEGLAVYGETEKEKGFGRGQGSTFHSMMRAEVANGLRSLSEISFQGYRGTDWPSGQVYLYGYYFFEFLEHRYDKKSIIKYIQNWNKNIVPWRMDARSRQVLSVSSGELWKQYQEYLEAKFRPEIDALKAKSPIVTTLIQTPRINSNPRLSAEGNLYFYQSDGSEEPSIQWIDKNNQIHQLATVQGFSQFDWNDSSGLLLARGEICDNTNVYADLYHWDVSIDRWQRLTECARYPRAAWRSDGELIAAVHVEQGRANLELLDKTGKLIRRYPPLAEGDSIGDVDWFVSDGAAAEHLAGNIVAAVKRKKTGWNLEVFDPSTEQWQKLTLNGDLESKPKFSENGEWVYFVSDKYNNHNVRKVRVTGGAVHTLSNSETYVKDFVALDKQLVLMEYTANGFTITSQPEKGVSAEHYEAKDAEPTLVQSFENSTSYNPAQYSDIKDYSPWPSIRPRSWWAAILADGDENRSLQLFIDGSDALGFHQWQLAPTYYFDKNELGGSGSYIFYNRFALLGSRTIDAIQEAVDGLPEIYEVEDRVQLIYMQPLNSLEESFRLHAGVARESVERIIENGNNLDAEDNIVGLSMKFSNVEFYTHSVSQEDGRTISLSFEKYNAFGNGVHEGPVITMDWREYVSLMGNHVLALRWVQGKASGDAKEFELGGNIDQLDALAGNIGFGLANFGLRGYDRNQAELEGHQVSLFSAEWRAPIKEFFDGFMAPPIGLGKTSMSLFVDTGSAWDAGESHRYYTGVGIELKPQILVGLDNFQLDTRVGFAYGLDKDLGSGSIYFRLGARF